MLLTGLSLSFLAFASCEKDDDDDSETTQIEISTATISGLVYANLNLTNDTVAAPDYYEKAPAGTQIIAIIDVEDLITNPEPGVNYGQKQFETTVQSDGSYSLEIDANTKAVNVTLKSDDFTYNQVISEDESKRKIFQAAEQYPTVTKNADKIIDIYYY